MQKIGSWVIVLMLLLLVGAAFAYRERFAPKRVVVADEAYQVTFMCDDNSHFVAHFTNHNTVSIDIDGTVVEELTQASSTSGLYFFNDGWDFHLSGQTASITRITDERTGSCHQPISQREF